MKTKTYSIENVQFYFKGKWEFKAGNYLYRAALNGFAQAERAAKIINGAIKRGGMDNMARYHLSQLQMKSQKNFKR